MMVKVEGVELADHPSDGELVAHARRFVKAADRMRPTVVVGGRSRRRAPDGLRTLLLAGHPGTRRIRPPGARGSRRALCRRRARARRRPRRGGDDEDHARKERRRSCPSRRRSSRTATSSSRTSPTSSPISRPKLGLAPRTEKLRFFANGLQLTITDFVAEIHDTHHPISGELYYEDQKKPAKARAAAFLDDRLPKFLGYFERVLEENPAGPQHSVGDWLTTVDLSLFQLGEGLAYAFPSRDGEIFDEISRAGGALRKGARAARHRRLSRIRRAACPSTNPAYSAITRSSTATRSKRRLNRGRERAARCPRDRPSRRRRSARRAASLGAIGVLALRRNSVLIFVRRLGSRGVAMPGKAIVKQQRRVFDAFFKVDEFIVSHEQIDGTMSADQTRLVFERGDAAAVLLLNLDSKSVVLVEQFKLPALVGRQRDDPSTSDGWITETAAGMVEAGELPEATAIRETMEETGYQIRRPRLIAKFFEPRRLVRAHVPILRRGARFRQSGEGRRPRRRGRQGRADGAGRSARSARQWRHRRPEASRRRLLVAGLPECPSRNFLIRMNRL